MSTQQASIGSNNVNFNELIDLVSTFGVKYNPVRPELTIPLLNQLKISAATLAGLVIAADNAKKKSISVRNVAFKGIDGWVTRINSAYSISGAPEPSIQQVASLAREFKGIRASKKPTAEEKAAAKTEGKELKTNVLHNTTFDKKIENFGNIFDYLKNSQEYGPNESDITIDALQAKLTEMKTTNSNCKKSLIDWNMAIISRDTVMFSDGTGLVDIAQDVKQYVKSVFGATSVQYKSVSKLKFRKTRSINNPDAANIQVTVS
jgi:hypothetical protein